MTWLKNNVIFLLAIAIILIALVVVIQFDWAALGFLVFSTALTAISSLATYMQALESRRQRENAERPDVAVYFQPRNRLMYCVIHNLGNLAATNVQIRFQPSPILHDSRKLENLSLFSKTIPFLPPQEKYWRHLGPTYDVIQKNSSPFEILVEYQSSEGKDFISKFVVDLTIMSEANDPELSVSTQLATISDHMEKIVGAIETERLLKLSRSEDPHT